VTNKNHAGQLRGRSKRVSRAAKTAPAPPMPRRARSGKRRGAGNFQPGDSTAQYIPRPKLFCSKEPRPNTEAAKNEPDTRSGRVWARAVYREVHKRVKTRPRQSIRPLSAAFAV
jgi:hypothetical protein